MQRSGRSSEFQGSEFRVPGFGFRVSGAALKGRKQQQRVQPVD